MTDLIARFQAKPWRFGDTDLCAVCRGAQNLVTFARGVEYWSCPGCGGSGVYVQYGPPFTHIAALKALAGKESK